MKKNLVVLFCLVFIGCATRKEVVYFQDAEQLPQVQIDSLYQHPEIQVNDILQIDLTALEPESLIPFQFNKSEAGQTRTAQGDALKLQGYLVNADGNIIYPGLGQVNVKAKTTQEVQQLLKKRLLKYVKQVSVRVRVVNFKFTVLGEVNKPGTFSIVEETISLPQAIGMAGDLTIQGLRQNVLIFRNVNGVLTSKRIDLTQDDWLNSPYYFLRQNDMVYVEPNDPKIKSSGFIGNIGTAISVFSLLLSTSILIFR